MVAITKELEEVVKIVSDRLSKLVTDAIIALTGGDGVPFDWEELDKREEIENYKLLKGSPDAFNNYIEQKAQGFIQKLKDLGLDDEQIHSIRPYEIVLVAVLNWSVKMEKKLEDINAVPS